MSLLKPIGNGRMYPGWSRWNPIPGCEHSCSYCYLLPMQERLKKDMMTPVLRNGKNGTKNYLEDDLGYHETRNPNNKVFVGSSGDMWGCWVPSKWRGKVLRHCAKHLNNEYMFLTKDPSGYLLRTHSLCGLNCILGVTIETDLSTDEVSVAPDPLTRLELLRTVRVMHPSDAKIMISIEPVMKFSPTFAQSIKQAAPYRVYVGVDSGNNGLPEPSADELRALIDELKTFTDVHLKKGIERILPEVGSPAVEA